MSDLDALLLDCLAALERGETVEAILARHPTAASDLRPLLETAVQLNRRPLQPTLAAQMQSRDTFLQAAVQLKNDRKVVAPSWFGRWRRAWLPVAVILLVLISGWGMWPMLFEDGMATAVPSQGIIVTATPPTPTPLPETAVGTPTPTVTATSTASPTTTATPTMTATATSTDTPTPTLTATTTVTPTPTATLTSTPDHDDDDDDDDHNDDDPSDDDHSDDDKIDDDDDKTDDDDDKSDDDHSDDDDDHS